MKLYGFDRKDIDIQEVAGAFEIPLAAKRLAASGQYAAIVTAAFVVDGGIYRHDFVAQTVVSALMQVQLETDVPVLSGVLTPHKYHATEEHNRFFRDHFRVKGGELADACVSTIVGSVTSTCP
jgi:6,7-dimethyl-8-ribityllumazine synthase